MQKKLSEKESNKIQVLRGIAIAAVVLIHNTPSGNMQIWFRPLINFPVALFLFLSGMLSCAEKWHPKKRLLKVLIPYVLWTFAYIILGNYRNLGNIQPYSFIQALATTSAAPILYYVFVYVELTLLIPLIDKLARSKYRWIGLAVSPLEIVIMKLIPLIAGYSFNRHIAILIYVSCLGWFSAFYLGYILGNGIVELKLSTSTLELMWVATLGLQILEGYFYKSIGSVNYGTQEKLSALLTGAAVSLLAFRYIHSEKKSSANILRVLGDHSSGIFYSHIAVMFILTQFPIYGAVNYFPVNAILTLIISFLFVAAAQAVCRWISGKEKQEQRES